MPVPIELVATQARAHALETPTVLVAGCGRATTVAALVERGVDAYGFDIDHRTVDSCDAPDRVIRADVRDPGVVEKCARVFGVATFDVIVTEKLLSCLTIEEAADACEWLRHAQRTVHYVVPASAVNRTTHTALTLEEWRAACDPAGHDLWLDANRADFGADAG